MTEYADLIDKYGYVEFVGTIYALNSNSMYSIDVDEQQYFQYGTAPNGEKVIIDYDENLDPISISLIGLD